MEHRVGFQDSASSMTHHEQQGIFPTLQPMNDAKLAFLIKLLGGLLDGSGLPVAKMDSHFDHESKVLLPHLPSTTRRCGTMWFSQFQEDQ